MFQDLKTNNLVNIGSGKSFHENKMPAEMLVTVCSFGSQPRPNTEFIRK